MADPLSKKYLIQKDVEQLIAAQGLKTFMQASIAAIEAGLRDFNSGKIQHNRRVGFLFDGNTIEAMPARRVGKLIAFKIVNFHNQSAGVDLPSVMSTTICLDEKTGSPLAVIDSTPLTAIRTGAISGLAIKHLFREAKSIGLLGAGVAGQASLQAACLVAKPEVIYVHDPNSAALAQLEAALEGFDHPAIKAVNPETVVRQSDVIISCTYASEVVIKKEWIDLTKRTLIVAVGADTPGKSEVEPKLYKEATVIVDFKEQAIVEGDVEIPIKQGYMLADSIAGELHEVVSGKSIEQKLLTIFDSTGDPVSDLIMAEIILAS